MRRRTRTKDISYISINRPLTDTVPNGTWQWEDIIMKLYCVFAALLAISLAEEIEDSEAAASIELLRTDREAKEEILDTSASAYNAIPPSQRPPRPWNPSQNTNPNLPPQNTWNNPNQYYPTPAPINNYYPPQNQNYLPNAPQIPQNNYQPSPPQNTNYQPPQNTNYHPTIPHHDTPVPAPPQAPQNDYYYPQNTWTTTQTVPVIKNEQFFGENGKYNYEYQIGDGTHVSEEGYLTNPNTEQESVVKRGWYSYVGGDGRVYTVKWWADDSGFHAFGDHLPTPPPVPPAIQASLDQAAKEEANKPQTGYPQPTQPPTYYPQPTQPPTYYPQPTQNPTYYPQNNYYPQPVNQQQYPNNYGK